MQSLCGALVNSAFGGVTYSRMAGCAGGYEPLLKCLCYQLVDEFLGAVIKPCSAGSPAKR